MREALYLGRADRVARAVLDRLAHDGFAPFHLAPFGGERLGAGEALDGLDPAAWRDALARRAPAIVVLAPGWHGLGPLVETSAAIWEQALARNVEAPTYALQAVARRLVERGEGGHVVALLHAAALRPYRGLGAYGTTLGALVALLRMLAVELAPHGVAVNALAPGFSPDGPLPLGEAALATLAADTPRGRLVRAPEVADAVALLARASGVALTGAVLPLHGGHGLTRGRTGPAPFAAGEDAG